MCTAEGHAFLVLAGQSAHLVQEQQYTRRGHMHYRAGQIQQHLNPQALCASDCIGDMSQSSTAPCKMFAALICVQMLTGRMHATWSYD